MFETFSSFDHEVPGSLPPSHLPAKHRMAMNGAEREWDPTSSNWPFWLYVRLIVQGADLFVILSPRLNANLKSHCGNYIMHRPS